MKNINVFPDQTSFDAVKDKLEKPQLSYVSDSDKIFCLSFVPAPTIEVVDLGLSVKWAKYNLGATPGTTPSDWYGGHYAWAELETKTDYSWSTYKYSEGTEYSLTKYNNMSSYGTVDNKMRLENEDDAAYVNQYQQVRIPTNAECAELRDESKITREWTSDYNGTGTAGYTFTSKVEGYVGNSIFIPAAGFYNGTQYIGAGAFGGIWTSDIRESEPSYAYGLTMTPSEPSETYNGKFNGMSVRGVQDK